MLISAFPGTGKTYLCKTLKDQGLNVFDSDSSSFKGPNRFVEYIDHVLEIIGTKAPQAIFISSHAETRELLTKHGLRYYLVYPALDLKDEYIQRYIDRESPQPFIDLMRSQFEAFVSDCVQQQGCHHIVLHSGQYLSDVLYLE